MASVAIVFVLTIMLAAILAVERRPPVLPAGTRIHNSSPAIAGLLPYMAYILATDDSRNSTWNYAGSLITRHAVLTSAMFIILHNRFTIRLGSIYRTESDPNAWTVHSTWFLVHPDYRKDSDAAIIFLPKKAPLNDYIQPARLPSSPDVPSFIGSHGIVSAWGFTKYGSGISEVLHWTEVVVVPTEICRKYFNLTTNTGRLLCAGSTNTTVDYDDYGAPLVLRTGGRFVQIGIFSARSSNYDYSTNQAVYTRVSSIIDWIKSNAGLDY